MDEFAGGFNISLGNGATYNFGAFAEGVEAADNIDTDLDGTNDANVSELTLFAGERDTLKFTDMSGNVVLNNVEGGGDISDDDFDFSALGITFDIFRWLCIIFRCMVFVRLSQEREKKGSSHILGGPPP